MNLNKCSILGWEPDTQPHNISISKTDEESGNVLKKSYSPSQSNNFQLLVKSYPIEWWWCRFISNIGDEIQANVKPQRIMHDHPHVHKL